METTETEYSYVQSKLLSELLIAQRMPTALLVTFRSRSGHDTHPSSSENNKDVNSLRTTLT